MHKKKVLFKKIKSHAARSHLPLLFSTNIDLQYRLIFIKQAHFSKIELESRLKNFINTTNQHDLETFQPK